MFSIFNTCLKHFTQIIDVYTGVLGDKVHVETIRGKVEFKINGTQSSTMFRNKEKE